MSEASDESTRLIKLGRSGKIKTHWQTSHFRILNRLRLGPATRSELLRLVAKSSGAPRRDAMGYHIHQFKLAGSIVKKRHINWGTPESETIYTLVKDAEKNVKESWIAMEQVKKATSQFQSSDPGIKYGKPRAKEEGEYHRKDGPVKIVKIGQQPEEKVVPDGPPEEEKKPEPPRVAPNTHTPSPVENTQSTVPDIPSRPRRSQRRKPSGINEDTLSEVRRLISKAMALGAAQISGMETGISLDTIAKEHIKVINQEKE